MIIQNKKGNSSRILFVIDTSGPGGAETVFIELLEFIRYTSFTPVIVIGGDGWLNKQLVERGFSPYILDPVKSSHINLLWKLITIIRKDKIVLVHAHLFGPAIYSSLAGIITGTPVISTIHGMAEVGSKQRFLHIKKMIINRGSNYIVTVSKNLALELNLILGLDQRKLRVIHNGIDSDRFDLKHSVQLKAEYGMCSDSYLIGAVGNIREPKDYGVMISAAGILVKRGLDFKLIIAGQGEGVLHDSLVEQVLNSGLKGIVEFIGFCKNIETFLSNLDLFVLSSRSEGFSIATIEAMAAGVPVVATRSGGPDEIIEDQVDGYLVETGSPVALAEAILDCISDSTHTGNMVVNAKAKVRHQFSVELMKEQYRALYHKLTGA